MNGEFGPHCLREWIVAYSGANRYQKHWNIALFAPGMTGMAPKLDIAVSAVLLAMSKHKADFYVGRI